MATSDTTRVACHSSGLAQKHRVVGARESAREGARATMRTSATVPLGQTIKHTLTEKNYNTLKVTRSASPINPLAFAMPANKWGFCNARSDQQLPGNVYSGPNM
jgi:hypothetical protein